MQEQHHAAHARTVGNREALPGRWRKTGDFCKWSDGNHSGARAERFRGDEQLLGDLARQADPRRANLDDDGLAAFAKADAAGVGHPERPQPRAAGGIDAGIAELSDGTGLEIVQGTGA
jgi:hypothetical protein